MSKVLGRYPASARREASDEGILAQDPCVESPQREASTVRGSLAPLEKGNVSGSGTGMEEAEGGGGRGCGLLYALERSSSATETLRLPWR